MMDVRSGWSRFGFFLLVSLCFAIPRLIELDRFVVIDEPRWLARSADFANALAHKEYQHTRQSLHPGVTVMWAGAAGFFHAYPSYVEDHPTQLEGLRSVEPYLRSQGKNPIQILAAGRTFVVLIIVCVMGLACWIAVRSIGWQTAFLGFLFIAFDPFHVALSRLLHLDGLQASFMFLSLMALASYLFWGRSRWLLVASGAAAGLSWLTRGPALFLLPFTFALMLIHAVVDQPRAWKRTLLNHGQDFAVWSAAGGICFFLLWPAMWVDPLRTLSSMVSGALSSAGEGHDNPLFFAGSVVMGDPGWSFYPVSYLFRSTPVTLLGLALSLILTVLSLRHRADKKRMWHGFALLLMAVGYVAFLSLSSKKFDRYMLPSFMALDFLAAMGWVALLRRTPDWVARVRAMRWDAVVRYVPHAGVVVLAAVQAAGTMRTQPYYFNYFNPALGGASEARDVIMYGWGEGLDQAARYLNQKPDAQDLHVLAWYASGPFDYFFRGKSDTLPFEPIPLDRISDYDYVVLYAHQWQRELPNREWLSYFRGRQAEHIIHLQDVPYAWIYDVRQVKGAK